MSERIALHQRAEFGLPVVRAAGKAAHGMRERVKTQPAPRKRKPAASSRPLRAKFIECEPKEGEIVFVLPLPPQKASPNGRGHWAGKARAVKDYRAQCFRLMVVERHLQKIATIKDRVVIDLEFYLCRVANDTTSCYSKDEDNARGSMKAAQDALKDAGIIAGDGKKHVRVGRTTLYTRAKEHQGFTCVVMTIRKESPDGVIAV